MKKKEKEKAYSYNKYDIIKSTFDKLNINF